MGLINALPFSAGFPENVSCTLVASGEYSETNANHSYTYTAVTEGLYYAGVIAWECFDGGSRSVTTTGTRLTDAGTRYSRAIEALVYLTVGQTVTCNMNTNSNRNYQSYFIVRIDRA